MGRLDSNCTSSANSIIWYDHNGVTYMYCNIGGGMGLGL